MHFTAPVRPDSLTNCGIILAWIKEGRAYAKLPSHSDFTLFPKGELPNFDHLNKIGTWFKAEVKEGPKFEIGQRGILRSIGSPRNGTCCTILTLFANGNCRVQFSDGQETTTDQENILPDKPRPAPKFEVGQEVTVSKSQGEVDPGELCQVVEVIVDTEGAVSYKLVIVTSRRTVWVAEGNVRLAKQKPKFKVGDHVIAYNDVLAKRAVGWIASVIRCNDGDVLYRVEETPGEYGMYVEESKLTRWKEEWPKFKKGDRVYLNCTGHYHNKQTGTVIEAFEGGGCKVQFEGHGCEHLITGDKLTLIKFAKGQRVKCEPTYRLAHWAKLEVVGVMGKTGEHLVYQLKATDRWGGEETVSASGDALRVVEEPTVPKRDEVLHWAERLILQLPQTHDGRNSWLMNYGSADTEVITDPKAVAQLVRSGVVCMTDANSATVLTHAVCPERVKNAMEEGTTFTWYRKEKRKD